MIVPICKPCNDRKGGHDSYVRDYFNFDPLCQGNPIVQRNIDGQITRSIRKGHSQFMKTAFHRATLAPRYSEGGIYLDQVVAIPLLVKRVKAWGTLVCRGLYFAHLGKRIPDNYEFEVRRIRDGKRGEAFDHFKGAGAHGPFSMGEPEEETDKVVSWMYAYDKEDEFRSMWMLWFYQSVFIEVHSGPPGDHQRIEAEIAARKLHSVSSTGDPFPQGK